MYTGTVRFTRPVLVSITSDYAKYAYRGEFDYEHNSIRGPGIRFNLEDDTEVFVSMGNVGYIQEHE